MDTETFWFLLLFVIVVACAFWYRKQKTERLINEGKIIERKGRFYEKKYQYTILFDNPKLMTQKIKELPYSDMGVSMQGSSARQAFQFNGGTFTAQLILTGTQEGKGVYCFNFTGWESGRGGGPYRIYEMNMLLTAIEKLILSVDQNAQVQTLEMETKTRLNFF